MYPESWMKSVWGLLILRGNENRRQQTNPRGVPLDRWSGMCLFHNMIKSRQDYKTYLDISGMQTFGRDSEQSNTLYTASRLVTPERTTHRHSLRNWRSQSQECNWGTMILNHFPVLLQTLVDTTTPIETSRTHNYIQVFILWLFMCCMCKEHVCQSWTETHLNITCARTKRTANRLTQKEAKHKHPCSN